MSVVLVFTPALAAAWPSLVPAISGAVATLGYALVRARAGQFTVRKRQQQEVKAGIEIAIENAEVIGKQLAADEMLTYEKAGTRITFFRDTAGKVCIHVTAKGKSDEELRRIGKKIAEKVAQQFVYNRVMTELKKRNFTVLEERVDANDAVRIRIRQSAP